jgi:hypothetical protein
MVEDPLGDLVLAGPPHAGVLAYLNRPRVPTRDPIDSNELDPAGGCWRGQSAGTSATGDHLPPEELAAVDSTGRPAPATRRHDRPDPTAS